LSEYKRVLKVGGVIRIIVPDAEKYFHAYCKKDGKSYVKLDLSM